MLEALPSQPPNNPAEGRLPPKTLPPTPSEADQIWDNDLSDALKKSRARREESDLEKKKIPAPTRMQSEMDMVEHWDRVDLEGLKELRKEVEELRKQQRQKADR